jgi:hypothetical protein
MFLGSSSKPIAPGLQRIVEQTEDDRSHVLAARAFRYPILQKQLEVLISEPRRFNVLEEFVLRAGLELVDPTPTENELATVFGLDPVFIDSTIQTLRRLGALQATPDSTIQLTEQGRQFYEQGAVPQPPRRESIVSAGDGLLGTLEYGTKFIDTEQPDLPDLLDLALFDAPVPDPELLELPAFQNSLVEGGSSLHQPAQGRMVTAVQATEQARIGWRSVTLLALHDLVEGEVTLQARLGPHPSARATDWFTARCAEEPGLINRLLEVEDRTLADAQASAKAHVNAAVAERQTRYEAMAAARLAEAAGSNGATPTGGGTVRLLRDGEIRKAFINSIAQAKQEILLFSPWISDQVVDGELLNRFRQAAQRGVFTIIGHGITSTPDKDDRPVPPAVVEALHAIRTPEGLPAVVLFWLGNSHAKEIVVDQTLHLSGSFNWLSYRGDYLPRGETVYEVTVPSEVANSRAYYEEKFRRQAQKALSEGLQAGDQAQMARGLAVLVGLGLVEDAWTLARQSDHVECVLDWLGLMAQRLRAGAASEAHLGLIQTALAWLDGKLGEDFALPRPRMTMLMRLLGLAGLAAPDAARSLLEPVARLVKTEMGQLPLDELWKLAQQEAQATRRKPEAATDSKPSKKKKR